MKRNKRSFVAMVGWVAVILMFTMPGAVYSAEEMSITGTVSSAGDLVADDGQVYTIVDDEMSNQLMAEEMGEKVKVTATVQEKEGKKLIQIINYEALSKHRTSVSEN
jgi:hypothetical protein